MKKNEPTEAQRRARLLAHEGDGTLTRRHGGVWMLPDEKMANTYPDAGRFTTTATILAMISKGLAVATGTSTNRLGTYATRVKLF